MVADPDVADAMARSFLGKLPPDLVDELLTEGERTDYPAGTTIYREGEAPRAVLVIEGLLHVYMTSAEGRQVTVRYAPLAAWAADPSPLRHHDPVARVEESWSRQGTAMAVRPCTGRSRYRAWSTPLR